MLVLPRYWVVLMENEEHFEKSVNNVHAETSGEFVFLLLTINFNSCSNESASKFFMETAKISSFRGEFRDLFMIFMLRDLLYLILIKLSSDF